MLYPSGMDIFELKCFGARAGGGNAALVVRGDASDEAARLAFAKAAGKPACVFVSDEAVPTLDYYYPHMRSPLCLHATLAAARVLLGEQPGTLKVRTALRGQELELSQRDGVAYVSLQRQQVPEIEVTTELAARLLAAPGIELASAPAIRSVGSPKLLLEVKDQQALHGLRPDLPAIAAWGKTTGVSGVYAWCRREDGDLEGRNFNHLDPQLEDAATGVAAGALTVLFKQSINLYQGANMGQPCLLRTARDGNSIQVGGRAEFV